MCLPKDLLKSFTKSHSSPSHSSLSISRITTSFRIRRRNSRTNSKTTNEFVERSSNAKKKSRRWKLNVRRKINLDKKDNKDLNSRFKKMIIMKNSWISIVSGSRKRRSLQEFILENLNTLSKRSTLKRKIVKKHTSILRLPKSLNSKLHPTLTTTLWLANLYLKKVWLESYFLTSLKKLDKETKRVKNSKSLKGKCIFLKFRITKISISSNTLD